jgi:hypothetical protein
MIRRTEVAAKDGFAAPSGAANRCPAPVRARGEDGRVTGGADIFGLASNGAAVPLDAMAGAEVGAVAPYVQKRRSAPVWGPRSGTA